MVEIVKSFFGGSRDCSELTGVVVSVIGVVSASESAAPV